MKKILILLILPLFLAGCLDTTGPEVKSIKLGIESTRHQIRQNPDSQDLNFRLLKELFSLDYAESKDVKPGNEPFLFGDKNNKDCIILSHGFTASPWELKGLGAYLFERNITVYGVLLAGHGTKKEDLEESTWEEWYEDVEYAYKALEPLCENIFAGGISLGGSLSLYLAEKEDIAGVISLASPIYLMDERAKYVSGIKLFKKYTESELDEDEKAYYYSSKPTASVEQLVMFINVYGDNLDKITAPILIMQAVDDTTVHKNSAEFIYNNTASKNKEIIWFNNSAHVLTTGSDKEEVFEKTYEFISNNFK